MKNSEIKQMNGADIKARMILCINRDKVPIDRIAIYIGTCLNRETTTNFIMCP